MNAAYKKVNIIGYGNVGKQLALAFQKAGIQVPYIVSRSINHDSDLPNTQFVPSANDLDSQDLVLVCVPDDKIHGVIESIPNHPIAYTSGAVELGSFDLDQAIGVFYPLQTFSKGRQLSLQQVPFFIEANNHLFGERLFSTAALLSESVQYADSTYRKKLHLSAVWINNFTNHIVERAYDIAVQNEIDIHHFAPLLKETIDKLDVIPPFEAQTGPARRNDRGVLDGHLRMLNGTDKELYRLISESIIKLYQDNEQL